MSTYRNLIVWQKSRSLTTDIYVATKTFPRDETFGLTLQLRRAAVSIVSNIAEGCGRWSVKENGHFLHIARGSALEVEAQLIIANDLQYLTAEEGNRLLSRAEEVGKLLNGLISSLRRGR